jgi:hypothetical protein
MPAFGGLFYFFLSSQSVTVSRTKREIGTSGGAELVYFVHCMSSRSFLKEKGVRVCFWPFFV